MQTEKVAIELNSSVGFWCRLWVVVRAVPSYLFTGRVIIE